MQLIYGGCTLAPSALGAFLNLGVHRVSSVLFAVYASLFIPFQAMCSKLEVLRNKDYRTSFKFPCVLDCPT